MRYLITSVAFVAVMSSGTMLGFFFAWYCSTLWGLDLLPPETAISAMNSMNSIVRNASFAPFFFGTPIYLAISAAFAFSTGNQPSAILFFIAAIIYVGGCILLTATINVPMNEALGLINPDVMENPDEIWSSYSHDWQFWNVVRMLFAGLSFLVGLSGLYLLNRKAL